MKKILLSLFVLISFLSFSQERENVDLTELIQESQIWDKNGELMKLTW